MKLVDHIKSKLKPKFESEPEYAVTGKGQYLIKYILDVYLNETRKDYIQSYEDMINMRYNDLVEEGGFKTFYDILGETAVDESFKRFLAAAQVYGLIVSVMSEEEQEKALNNINSEIIRYFIRCIVKQKVL